MYYTATRKVYIRVSDLRWDLALLNTVMENYKYILHIYLGFPVALICSTTWITFIQIRHSRSVIIQLINSVAHRTYVTTNCVIKSYLDRRNRNAAGLTGSSTTRYESKYEIQCFRRETVQSFIFYHLWETMWH